MHRSGWQDGADARRVAVPAARAKVWEQSADPYTVRRLRLDNPTGGAIVVFVTTNDVRISRTHEVRLGPGCGEELRVWGAVTVEAAQLTAAGLFLDVCPVATDDENTVPNLDRQVTLVAGAPGPWTEIGPCPPGRRWCSVAVLADPSTVDVAFFDATGVTRFATFMVPANGRPETFIFPQSLKLFARCNGVSNAILCATWAS
jgi:hypothetical protein